MGNLNKTLKTTSLATGRQSWATVTNFRIRLPHFFDFNQNLKILIDFEYRSNIESFFVQKLVQKARKIEFVTLSISTPIRC